MISRVWLRFHVVSVCKWVCSHNRVHAIYYYIIINAVEKRSGRMIIMSVCVYTRYEMDGLFSRQIA